MEFGQKNYGGQATQSAGNAPGIAPNGAQPGGLDMGGDSSKVKMGILGGIVAVFGIGAAVALSGGDEKVAAQHRAQAEQQQMMTPTEMATGTETAAAGVDPNAAANVTDSNGAAMTATPMGDQEVAGAPAPAAAAEQLAAAPVSTAAPAPEPAAPSAEPTVAATPEPAMKAPQADPAVSMAAAESAASSVAPTETANETAAMPATEATGDQQAVSETRSASAETPKAAPTNKQLPQAADALDAWWQKSEANTGGFGVQFVGQAAGQPSLVIRFSQLADPNVAAQHIKVKSSDGSEVATNWQKGANDYVLVNPNLAPGRYTVSIDPGLTSSTGSTLGTPLNGPIYIQ